MWEWDTRSKVLAAAGAAIVLAIALIGVRLRFGDIKKTEPGFLPVEEAALRYVYQNMNEREKMLYTALCEGIEQHAEEIRLPDTYTDKEYDRVYLSVCMQEPQFFYLDEIYELAPEMTSARMYYTEPKENIAEMREKLDAAAERILKTVSPVQNENQKLLMLHDGLVRCCTYAEGIHSDDAYGALVGGFAQCEGYSKAFLYLARKAGLNVMCVPGRTKGTNHIWNMAKIGASYYHIDVTWDDDDVYGNIPAHSCFAVPDAQFKDHKADTDLFTPPESKGTQQTYYHTHAFELSHAGELQTSLQRWTGAGLTEFRCRDSQVFREVRELLKKDGEVNALLQRAVGAEKVKVVADTERWVVVILPAI